MTISVNPMPTDSRLYSNVTPFTARDNATYLIVLEDLRQFVNDKLVPFINENGVAVDEKVQELIESWNEQSVQLIQEVQTIADTVDASVEEAQTARNDAVSARDEAALYASTVEEIQDAAVTNLFTSSDSDFRLAFNTVIDSILVEDVNDPGTFILDSAGATVPPVEPGAITPDPNDPGFFV